MKTLKFLILFLFLLSCTSEPDFFDFTAILTNESGSELTVSFYDNEELVNTVTLNQSESTTCNYSAETFDEFRRCGDIPRINAMTVVFSNGKGYSCDLSSSSEQVLCFENAKNPLLAGDFNDLGNRQYEFIITEEDFNNAHDLPE